jgi:hypothetical protein
MAIARLDPPMLEALGGVFVDTGWRTRECGWCARLGEASHDDRH